MSDENLKVVRLLDAVSITASGSCIRKIDLSTLPIYNWTFTYQCKVTGTGVVAGTFKHSLDGVNFVDVTENNGIFTGGAVAAIKFGSFAEAPLTAKWLEITVTETGGAATAVVTLDIGVR